MRALVVTTIIDTIEAFLLPHIDILLDSGYDVDIATNINVPTPDNIMNKCDNIYNIEFNRSPLSTDNVKAYKKIKNILNTKNYDIVYVHTPIASAITRLACKNIKNIKDINIIYFAHGFHFFEGAPIKNWIIFYPIEKYLSKFTDILITINKEDYERANKRFKAKKTVLLNGVGIDLKKIQEVIVGKEEKRKELGLKKEDIVLLSVGELNSNKNHIEVLKAINMIDNKENIKYLICGRGDKKQFLNNYIHENGLDNNVELLGFRNDIIEICKISDIFIFPSKREGLPVSVMEAMACGLPVICSNIRGNIDLIDDYGGKVVKKNNMNYYYEGIINLIKNPLARNRQGAYNLDKIKKFDKDEVLQELKLVINDIKRGNS
ncbi:glycosyltransferase [Anaerococcus sp.]|uniref:glycosyltransferase n=1 Tax=Anaerococcus sp. TaxID=1872515 RepID=UPI0027B896E0|nr:glycosyltransferase [Anaerococcus sp.]